jgi:hypothetical protein
MSESILLAAKFLPRQNCLQIEKKKNLKFQPIAQISCSITCSFVLDSSPSTKDVKKKIIRTLVIQYSMGFFNLSTWSLLTVWRVQNCQDCQFLVGAAILGDGTWVHSPAISQGRWTAVFFSKIINQAQSRNLWHRKLSTFVKANDLKS